MIQETHNIGKSLCTEVFKLWLIFLYKWQQLYFHLIFPVTDRKEKKIKIR